MRGLILCNAFDKSKNISYKVDRMREELSNLGVTTEVRFSDELTAETDGEGRLSVEYGCDFVLFFDKDKYLSSMLEKAGYRLFNGAEAIRLCDDKMLTHIALSNEGIKMPHTLPGALCYIADAEINERYLSAAASKLGWPMVVKECYGSYGQQVYLAKDAQELKKTVETVKGKAYLFQKFIEVSAGRDVRVIVVGGKAVAAMQRRSEVDFRSNVELGGKAFPVELADSFKQVAEKAADVLKLDYCGIDILFGEDGGPILCEVNSNAMFKAIEGVSGVNVAKQYAEHIVKTVKNGR